MAPARRLFFPQVMGKIKGRSFCPGHILVDATAPLLSESLPKGFPLFAAAVNMVINRRVNETFPTAVSAGTPHRSGPGQRPLLRGPAGTPVGEEALPRAPGPAGLAARGGPGTLLPPGSRRSPRTAAGRCLAEGPRERAVSHPQVGLIFLFLIYFTWFVVAFYYFFFKGKEKISATARKPLVSPEGWSGAGGRVHARARPGGGMSRCPARAGISPAPARGEGRPPPAATPDTARPRRVPRAREESPGQRMRVLTPWGG